MKILLAPLLAVSFAAIAAGASMPLFDGKTLDGWEGDAKLWRVQDGMITGGSLTENIPRNEFLATKKSFHNFDLRVKIKLTGAGGFVNSGIQVRSIHVPGSSEMSGYQVDAGDGWWGKLYDESRRNKVIAEPIDAAAADKAVRRNDWNEYRVRCEGPKLQAWINGVATLDYAEADPKIAQDGLIGIQVHGGGKTVVQVKEVIIEELPPTPNAPRWPEKTGATEQRAAARDGSESLPRSSSEERAAFTLPPGFVAELVADESVMKKAVAFNFDDAGRMWVTTASEYPLDGNEQPEKAAALYNGGGRDNVLVFDTPWADGLQRPRVWAGLEEGRRARGEGATATDQHLTSNIERRTSKDDGKSDKPKPPTLDARPSTIPLAMPMGVLPYKDGAIIQHGTELLFLRDTDGDGRADKREVLLKGFGIQDSHLMPHGFTRGPGDWIYFAQGAFNTSPVQTKEGPIVEVKYCKMMRMKPDGSHFEICSWGPNNIWGFVIDPRGEMWIQEANDLGYPLAPFQPGMTYPGIGDDKPKPYAPVMPPPAKLNDCTMGGTGLSGLALNENASNWPEPWTGAFMVANPITNKIQAIRVHREGSAYDGVKLEKLPDFLVSADTHFRPVAIQFGPDGALYVIDWYNRIISHNEVPRTHPERDKVRTRIWRIRAKSASKGEVPNLTKATPEKLVAHLAATNQWEANAARFELVDRGLIEELGDHSLKTGGEHNLHRIARDKTKPLRQRLQAFWALFTAGSLHFDTPIELARENSADIKREVLRSLRTDIDWSVYEIADEFGQFVDDPDPAVRIPLIAELGADYHYEGADKWLSIRTLLRFASKPDSPLDASPVGRFDRAFERYLIRSSLERERAYVTRFLESSKATDVSPEGQVLLALAIDPKQGSLRLLQTLSSLNRALASDELALLASQVSEPRVHHAFAKLLIDPGQQKATLIALANLDPKILGSARDSHAVSGDPPKSSGSRGNVAPAENSILTRKNAVPPAETLKSARDSRALSDLIADAVRDLMRREPTDANYGLLVRLAKNLRVTSLEPDVAAYLVDKGRKPSEQIEGLKALRELGSDNVDLFRKLADTRNEELRREAVTTLAGAQSERVVPTLIELWPRLSPPLRKIALDRAASSKAHAPALVRAAKNGLIPGDDFDGATLDKLVAVLGNNDPELVALLKEMKGAMRPVLRLTGKPGDIVETKIDLRGAFTVEAWIRLDTGIDNNDNLLGRKGGADINFYDAKLRVFGSPAVHDVIVAKSAVKPDTWTHVAVTRDDAGRLRIYLNGDLDAESAAPFKEPLPGLNIGETNPGKGCGASYTEFRVWDVARTAEEIRDNYLLSFAAGTDAVGVDQRQHPTSNIEHRTSKDGLPVHLVRYMSGANGWGALKGAARIEETRDFPELLSPLAATALAEKFSQFRMLAAKDGNADNGRNLFNGVCMACHQVNGQGGNIGPNLSGAGAMGTESLLRNILTPNAQLESGYYRHDVELKSGDFVSGFLVSQNDREIVMRPIGADDRTLPRSEIKKLTVSKKSLMPEGLLEGLPPQQVNDLFAYLRTLK